MFQRRHGGTTRPRRRRVRLDERQWSHVLVGAALAACVVLGLGIGRLGSPDTGLMVGVLTLIGVLVTVSANQMLAARSEQRLRLDAALEAGKLLNGPDGGAVNPAVAASSLLALTDLGRSKLAVAILVDLWRHDAVSPEVAVLVIDQALDTGDDSTAQIAAEVLCQNADKLDPTAPAHWPSVLDDRWVPDATEKTKILLVEALVGMCTNDVRGANLNALRTFVIRMVRIHEHEREGRFKHCLAGFVRATAHAMAPDPEQPDTAPVFVDGERTVDHELLQRIGRSWERNPDTFYAHITRDRRTALAAWATECRRRGADSRVGALAIAAVHPTPPSALRVAS